MAEEPLKVRLNKTDGVREFIKKIYDDRFEYIP